MGSQYPLTILSTNICAKELWLHVFPSLPDIRRLSPGIALTFTETVLDILMSVILESMCILDLISLLHDNLTSKVMSVTLTFMTSHSQK